MKKTVKKVKKVFCKDCKYRCSAGCGNCTKQFKNIIGPTFWAPEIIEVVYKEMCVLNKNNTCKYYEEESKYVSPVTYTRDYMYVNK